jgi:hypothetical protein
MPCFKIRSFWADGSSSEQWCWSRERAAQFVGTRVRAYEPAEGAMEMANWVRTEVVPFTPSTPEELRQYEAARRRGEVDEE